VQIIDINITKKEYRLLLDLVYVGNWVLNSMRDNDRFQEYDEIQETLFSKCEQFGMKSLAVNIDGAAMPSREYEDGGIHEAIADYEDAVFFEILAEELARRDMNNRLISPDDFGELTARIDEYIAEFEKNGVENISLDI
jgi:hypothetical protein